MKRDKLRIGVITAALAMMIAGGVLTWHKFFAVFGSADHDLMTCKGIIIIGMHRLAVFFHYIVCDIDNVVDRTDSI